MEFIIQLFLVYIFDLAGTVNYGLSPETYDLFTSWYYYLWGASCTTDLDTIHQGRYVIGSLLNVVYHLLTGEPSLFEVCIIEGV